MMNEYVAVMILIIIIFAIYFYRESFYAGKYNPILGSHINYGIDIPKNTYGYNRIYHMIQPPTHDMILYTEELYKGIAIPVRKGKKYLFADQVSPHFKTYHYKSIAILPGTKIRLFAETSSSLYNQKIISVDFVNISDGIMNINTFIKKQPNLISSEFGNKFNNNIINTKYYLQEL